MPHQRRGGSRLCAGRVGSFSHQRPSQCGQGITRRTSQRRRPHHKPFTNKIDLVYFDFLHYDGRTSKHGAFMGSDDFVQWHGNYPMLSKMVELQDLAARMRREHGRGH